MARRFAFALVAVALLCFPAYGENSAFNDAVTKAARISGLWEATPDQAQALIFPSDSSPVTHLFLNIHTRIRQNGDSVETTIAEARLELEEKLGLDPPVYIYDQIFLRDDGPITGDRLEFSGQRCCEPSTGIRIRVVPGSNGPGVTVLISWAGRSTYVGFARPAENPNTPVQGDWITPECVLHVYVMEPFRVAATFDKISTDQVDLGYPFSDSGSDVKNGLLMMHLDTLTTFNWLDGKLDGTNLLRVKWRGNGFLSEPDFHRLAAGKDAQAAVPKL